MISINYRDSEPIYRQIENGFKKLILSGAIEKDSPLPSIRHLASSMAINPNTIQRAYAELEGKGFIYSVPGKGSFVSGTDEIFESRKKELMESFKTISAELIMLGVKKEDLIKLVEKVRTMEETEAEND